MKICVYGLWHLGSVTAACLASLGHDVIAIDEDQGVVKKLNMGIAPLFEPGLDDLLKAGIDNGKLYFYSDITQVTEDTNVFWVTFDTPVNDADQADTIFVNDRIQSALSYLPKGTIVLVSSQMPVGSIRKLEEFAEKNLRSKNLLFAYSPENLRLGKSIEIFLKPDRVILGVRNTVCQSVLEKLFHSFSNKLEWMSVESAEMTKHAINSFLAVSVTFANEIASLCELVGADAKEVERGLKTESRIGPKAYLSPGGPFSGGTLARDIIFLRDVGQALNLPIPLLSAVSVSNDLHKNWAQRQLKQRFKVLRGLTVAIWGLTYKTDTDTLRRSHTVDLCNWLINQGACVRVYDPVVKNIPDYWTGKVIQCVTAFEALKNAKVLVVGTEWPEFRQSALDLRNQIHHNMIVLDANRYLQDQLCWHDFNYVAVGVPLKNSGQ